MEDTNEKSLKVLNESIFEKIKKFILKIFRKDKIEIVEVKEEKEETIKFTIEKTEEEKQQDLIKRIESEEIIQEEQKDEELEKMKKDLSRYLGKIKKEIDKGISENKV